MNLKSIGAVAFGFCFCMWGGFSVAQKQMCQISGRGLIGGCQGVVYCAVCPFINNNGPAIKGGCVTRRKHRAESRYFSQKTVTVQGGYGTRFCSPGTKLVEHYEYRGTKLIASHIFIPGYKILCVAVVRSGFIPIYKAVLEAGANCKNRHKQLTFIVRVIRRSILIFQTDQAVVPVNTQN